LKKTIGSGRMRALTQCSSDATAENVRIGWFGAKGADGVVTEVGGEGEGGGGGRGGPAARCSTLEEVIAMRRSGSGKVVIEPKETSYSSKRDLIYAQKRPKVVIEQDNLVFTPHTHRLYTHAQTHTHMGHNAVLERAGGGGDGGGGGELKASLQVHGCDMSSHLPQDMDQVSFASIVGLFGRRSGA